MPDPDAPLPPIDDSPPGEDHPEGPPPASDNIFMVGTSALPWVATPGAVYVGWMPAVYVFMVGMPSPTMAPPLRVLRV